MQPTTNQIINRLGLSSADCLLHPLHTQGGVVCCLGPFGHKARGVMVDFVKKKIVEKLARFTKHLKPSDISFSFLSGKGHLSNLELNGEFISEALQLPPWLTISRVLCDTIRARVPFTNINTDPVNFYIGQVIVEVSTSTNATSTTATSDGGSAKLLNQLGGNPSKYSLIDKVIDGMRVEVRSVLVFLKDPSFHAQLEMTDILLESTSWEWKVVPLNKARVRIEDEDSVINYKVCRWSSLKIEGWSTDDQATSHNQLRLIAGPSKIFISFKRSVLDSSIMCFRVVVSLGDLIWILTQSQLRAVSRLVQSLMDAAVRTSQDGAESDGDSDASLESVCSVSSEKSSERAAKKSAARDSKQEEKKKKRKRRPVKTSSHKLKLIEERVSQYREGKRNLPAYEVIQNSLHMKTGKVDLQLCDDMGTSGATDTVQGSMLIEVFELLVDIYLDQPAGVGRAHWNTSNDVIDQNAMWSRKLISTASKTQFLDLPSVNLSFLHERGVVIRCSDFAVNALKKSSGSKADPSAHTLPIVTSDKATFSIPNDRHNPALQVGVTLYFYPDKYGSKFLVPRPNLLVYMSPVHVNLHQESCLWLVEFAHGLVKTVNIDLALSVKEQGQSFLEEIQAKSERVQKLPGVDLKFKILFTKVTLPLPGAVNDGRPKALQIETSAIKMKNCPLNELLGNSSFTHALEAVKDGWLFTSQEGGVFPHLQTDLRALPRRLQELLQQEVKVGRKRGESVEDTTSLGSSSTGLAPVENKAEMIAIEGWHVSTSCVHVAFANNYTHSATLRTKSFISDFPVHLWLFLPPSPLDSTNPPTPSSSPHAQEPKFSVIAHVSSEIRVELERLQLLFLLRLKDSFTAFKTSLMKFLDPATFAPNLKETLEAHHVGSDDSSPPATISGCVAVSQVEASILLPTLYPTQPTPTVFTPTPSDSPSEDPSTNLHPKTSPVISRSSTSPCLTNTTRPTSSPQLSRGSSSLGEGQAGLSASPSPSGSLASLPMILEAGEKGEGPKYASTSLLTAPPTAPPPARAHAVPVRAYSAVELTSQLPPRLDSMDYSTLPEQDRISQDRISQDSRISLDKTLNKDSSFDTTSQDRYDHDQDSVQSLARSEISVLDKHSTTQQEDPLIIAKDKTNDDDFVLVKYPATTLTNKPHPHHPRIQVEESVPPIPSSSPPAVVTPPSDTFTSTVPPPEPSVTSPTLSTSSKTARRQKSPAPPRTVPGYVLHAQVQHVLAMPCLKAGEITMKLSVDTIGLRELSVREYQGMKELQHKRKAAIPTVPTSTTPCLKARFELGDHVGRWYPESCAKDQDVVLIGKVEGIDLSLLLPNITIMKDFFDDEFESDSPLPMHLKVVGTRAVLLEDLAHSADHAQSMSVGVDQLEVHRGRELKQEVDIFMASNTGLPRSEAVSGGSEDGREVRPPDKADDHLLHSFSEFISAFETHVQHHGRVLLPQPQRVADLLQELQSALLPKPSVSPPPTYTEVVPSPYVIQMNRSRSASSAELLHLRRENEKLRQVQRQSETLSAQLKESQVEMERRETDLLMVTDECKRTKEQLVSYKQVMEKQQEHIEKLLTENFDLQRQLLPPSS